MSFIYVEVPVRVTVQVAGDRLLTYRWPDSGEVAKVVHAAVHGEPWESNVNIVSVDGVPSDPDDPNSPPVPASPVA